MPRLAYLSLETPIRGQAAFTHTHEIIAGLERLGWEITPYFATLTGASKGSSLIARLKNYLTLQIHLMRDLYQYDVVFVRGHFAAFLIALVCHTRGVPIVHEINGTLDDIGVTYPWARRILEFLKALQNDQYRRATHIFAVTPQLTIWAKRESDHERVTTVMNGVNTTLFNDEGARHHASRPYVIFVGGLVKWHGIATLLKALSDPAWPSSIDVMIVGDGIERHQLETCAHPRLIWMKHQPYDHIPTLIRGALAGLVPIESPSGRSDYGVLPLKLFEMMACGVPVIATDLPAQREIVHEAKAGLIIPPANPQALARAVAQLSNDQESARVLGHNGAQAARLKHDWNLRAAQINDVMQTIIKSRGNDHVT
jgi:glycosyltransferase involved in cell wall biosynthesis